MLVKVLFFILLIFFSTKNYAQCIANHSLDKIMLMGDSWAFYMMSYYSHNNALDKYGFSDINLYSSTNLSINGAKTTTFLSAAKKQEVINELNNKPQISIVHISLGGNDLLGNWNVSMDSLQTDSLIETVILRLDSIVNYIKQNRPDLKIYISSYDYPNFGETATNPSHPFYDTWQKMGFPDFYQINTALTWYVQKLKQYTDSTVNVSTVDCRGLMQYYYGQTTPLTVPPGGTYPPYTAPLPGGFINYPTPKSALGFGGYDSFHLSSDAYQKFVDYQFEHYFFNTLLNESQYIIYCDTIGTGTITNGSIIPYTFICGNDGINNYIVQFTFNTSVINTNDNIKDINLFICADSNMTNLFNQYDFTVWVKNGYFGNAQLEPNDFSDTLTATKFISPCHYGIFNKKGNWLRITLDGNIINTSGVTQIQIVFNMLPSANIMYFTSATDSIHRPILTINTQLPNAIKDLTGITDETKISIYPNPVQEYINIKGLSDKNKVKCEIFDLTGKLLEVQNNTLQLKVKHLNTGIYFLKITFDKKVEVKTFIKN